MPYYRVTGKATVIICWNAKDEADARRIWGHFQQEPFGDFHLEVVEEPPVVELIEED